VGYCSWQVDVITTINLKRLPGVPLDVFFGIKAQDSEGLKSEIQKQQKIKNKKRGGFKKKLFLIKTEK
jgi:hypothetical protein